ncbi:hypothetical protein TVAG_062630 [Trichomonas vaginalis G3]|uniref:Uncharacterized protein n=1 Tax=Trichomonas vaginalis (strain ATCC PRA-98 / G3) TaxID=412133 RepID=A2DLM5_TRIV3|nr:hypothetical protein TVAGG3_0580520 [Trichomonas vaginalis G3]EAY18658.1 hypothetical protein TVAG_062630 [Trichomonas vaginalis G3]KAI5522543.1 hypothetical protein TVAGG3_0580520 [Trichomonas vaginalis G3]|eukprot:XP_001579644.1 hypothetical protein [Trichomonas vaginalis G3]
MSEELQEVNMSYVLAWHPYSRANDLPEAFGQFAKELEVVARSRGGVAAVDLFTGRGLQNGFHIAKTILQSVVFGVTDIYDLCLQQADEIEKCCVIEEHDMVAKVKGLEQGERVPIHFGPVPELFDSLCEFLCCNILRRVLEMWMAVAYVKAAHKVANGDANATVPNEKMIKFLTYIATELSEPPLVVDDDLLEWIKDAAQDAIKDIDAKFQEFKGLSAHRVDDFIFMINWQNLFINLYNDILVISEIIYTSYGSSKSWDQSPLLLPIVMMSAGAVSLQRTIMNVFKTCIPENAPKMRAHQRLMQKLFPA